MCGTRFVRPDRLVDLANDVLDDSCRVIAEIHSELGLAAEVGEAKAVLIAES